MEEVRANRVYTPEQKYEIMKGIEACATIQEGLSKYNIHSSSYYRWQKQLSLGIQSSLRNTKPLKAPELKALEAENRKLKEIVLNQSAMMTNLKKEMRWD